eukprot:TRINITY_DN1847_c0_g1_i1.p2 TRINITY_DN1847_c0_g1~~TRINITY_DN1847_c0_g1_i1.p2  ORF type:complete len:124 (+),score=17.70 TRINITY_DN1847_c0_g1_i1:913-1284(+)
MHLCVCYGDGLIPDDTHTGTDRRRSSSTIVHVENIPRSNIAIMQQQRLCTSMGMHGPAIAVTGEFFFFHDVAAICSAPLEIAMLLQRLAQEEEDAAKKGRTAWSLTAVGATPPSQFRSFITLL